MIFKDFGFKTRVIISQPSLNYFEIYWPLYFLISTWYCSVNQQFYKAIRIFIKIRNILYIKKLRSIIFFLKGVLLPNKNSSCHQELNILYYFSIQSSLALRVFVACKQFEKITVVKLGALHCKELSQNLLHLRIILEEKFRQCGFQCSKQVKVRWGKISAVGRMIQSLLSEVTNLILWGPC